MATEDRVQHTPGPWRIREGNGIEGEFRPGEWAQLASMAITTWSNPDGGRNQTLREQTPSNARLIAAAPDMLAALDRIAHGDSGAAGQRAETTLELAKALAFNAQNIARDAIARAAGGAA